MLDIFLKAWEARPGRKADVQNRLANPRLRPSDVMRIGESPGVIDACLLKWGKCRTNLIDLLERTPQNLKS